MTGSLEPGKRADIVRFDGDSFGAAVVHDPYQQIVYGAGPESIADVWVDGRRLLADGAFCLLTRGRSLPRCANWRATWQERATCRNFHASHADHWCGTQWPGLRGVSCGRGHQVTVIERAPVPGGCTFTEEIVPGYRFNTGAIELEGIVHSGVDRDLGLQKHGLRGSAPGIFLPRISAIARPCFTATCRQRSNGFRRDFGPEKAAEEWGRFAAFASTVMSAVGSLQHVKIPDWGHHRHS
jgi:hypothetical protein